MIIKFIDKEFREWLETRPQSVKDLAAKYHPYATYRYKIENKLCTLYSYRENGTVVITIFDEVSLKAIERVSDVNPEDLEECDVTDIAKENILS
jgi:hypothetical protein